MIILDTNVVSELMKPQKSEIVRNWAAQQSLTNLFTTTINHDNTHNKSRVKILPFNNKCIYLKTSL